MTQIEKKTFSASLHFSQICFTTQPTTDVAALRKSKTGDESLSRADDCTAAHLPLDKTKRASATLAEEMRQKEVLSTTQTAREEIAAALLDRQN